MKIGSLFQKDINRSIQGVIKVEKAEEVFQELDEFVITREVRDHFQKFFRAYNRSLDTATDEIGAWISGFFGSGKSHLLKILSYILENSDIEGTRAIEFFEEKLQADPLFLAEIKRAITHPAETLLFNIESKSSSNDRASKSAIVDILMKVFNEHCGYCGDVPWLAEIERNLDKEGQYDSFKKAYAECAGEEWQEGRHKSYFIRDYFVEAITNATTGMSKESAELLFDNADKNYALTVEKFTLLIREYLEKKGKDHRIVFLADEMGQYIGDNSHLMLNLQTVTENLGIHCQGKAWVVVTSQEAIDTLTKNRLKDQDFSKIQGRFTTRLNLSSSNTDEVIKKRLLAKTDVAKETLGIHFDEQCASMKNLISFSTNSAGMRGYQNAQDFIEAYPFVTYQFNLLQKVFECIRKFSHAGKHLAEGERSMLNAFHTAVKEYGASNTGILIPFQTFYRTIESFLDSSIKRIFELAKDEPELEHFDIEVLKVLFMIKHVKEIRPDIENIATLMIDTMTADKIALRSSIDASLTRLKMQTLISQNGEFYDFLTDEEQDVERAIRSLRIDFQEILAQMGKRIFDDIYPDKNFMFSKFVTCSFSKKIDDIYTGKAGDDLTLAFVTPENIAIRNEFDLKNASMTEGLMLVKLPLDRRYLDEIEMILKTERFIKEKSAVKVSESVETILSIKRKEIETRKERAVQLIDEAIQSSRFFASGRETSPEGNTARAKLDGALRILTEDTFHKLSLIEKHLAKEDDLRIILTGGEQTTIENENSSALMDMRAFITGKHEWRINTSMLEMKNKYTRKPYGWSLLDMAAVCAALLARKEIKLEYNGESINASHVNAPVCLTKEKDFEKVLVFLRTQIEPHLVETGKEAAQAVFGCYAVPDEGEELARKIRRECIKEELEALNALYGYYGDGKRYPGKPVIDQGINLLKALVDKNDAAVFLESLREKKEELIQWKSDAKSVKEFFKDKKKHFDRALHCIDLYDTYRHYLEDDDLITHAAQELDEIIHNPAPYGLIKDIPSLVECFNDRYDLMLKEMKERQRQNVESDWSTVLAELDKHSFDQKFCDELRAEFDAILSKLEQAGHFGDATVRGKSQKLMEQSLKKIDEHQPGETTKVKETVKINPLKCAGNKKILENESDVEEYLVKLKEALGHAIKENKKVLLTN
ncbi:MAG: BREX system P-loop protein BrxC [Vulcanimicrobiota bacterium]